MRDSDKTKEKRDEPKEVRQRPAELENLATKGKEGKKEQNDSQELGGGLSRIN